MEKVVEVKQCKHCNISFEITDKDLEFYEKVSPVFDGKKYNIPTPTLCPECRQQRRLSNLNSRKLYNRKCDATGKSIVSLYNSDKPYKVYNQDFWWSDKWSAMNYGIDFDFNQVFFEQFNKLRIKVPMISLSVAGNENSEYVNWVGWSINCYLCFHLDSCQNLMYSQDIIYSENTIDCLLGENLKGCYECINCYKCYSLFFSINSYDCNNSSYLNNCNNCDYCFGCINLINKKYFIYNIHYSEKKYRDIINGGIKFNINKLKGFNIKNNLTIKNSAYCIGDYIKDSNNVLESYDCIDSKNLKYCNNIRFGENLMDFSRWANKGEKCYECAGVGKNAFNILFSKLIFDDVLNSYYCNECTGIKNCFGCIGLKSKEYCILNKQYTKEKYNILVPKIINHMKTTGEWGEFFPSSISPFGYNETVANEYFPLKKEEALKQKFNWSDYEAPFPKVEKIIPASKFPYNIKNIPDDILNRVIECEITKKPFKIIKPELEFYRKHNLPIPRRHPDQRHLDRMKLINPRKLFDRKCDKCKIDMKTTYGPDRKEIVYCEKCYNKEVY